MHTIAQMVAQGYRVGAPTQEVEEMDAQVVEGQPCPKCGGPMRYEGHHHRTPICSGYVTLAVCDDCGYELAFWLWDTTTDLE
jgi:RecJ-like exonuclease